MQTDVNALNKMTITAAPATTSYELRWKPTTPGLYPVWLTGRDVPPTGVDPCEVPLTILWQVTPRNTPPKFHPCGGLP
jgi:hypothetical protein